MYKKPKSPINIPLTFEISPQHLYHHYFYLDDVEELKPCILFEFVRPKKRKKNMKSLATKTKVIHPPHVTRSIYFLKIYFKF